MLTKQRNRLTLLLAAAFSVSAAACDRSPTVTAAAPDAALQDAAEMHPCSPYIDGPTSLAANQEATYTFYYFTGNGCGLQNASWSVNNGAQIVWIEAPMLVDDRVEAEGGAVVSEEGGVQAESAPAGYASGGRARIRAGQCDFGVSVASSYTNGSSANSYLGVLVRDCGPLHVSLTAASGPWGGIQLAWNAVRADHYRVYRRPIPRAGSPDPGWVYQGSTTGTTWTDTKYRIADRFVFDYNLYYKVEAWQNGGYHGLYATAFTYAKLNSIDEIQVADQ